MVGYKRKKTRIYLIFILSFILYISKATPQQFSRISIRDSISIIKQSKNQLANKENELNILFKAVNKKITLLKKELKNKFNPLKKIELNDNLKKSNSLANQIDSINNRRLTLNKKLNDLYKILVELLNSNLNAKLKILKQINDLSKKIEIIKQINSMEQQKKQLNNLIQKKTVFNTKKLNLVIEPDDDFVRIQLKTDIIKDKINSLKKVENELNITKKELNSDLSIYKEMLDFIKDIRRDIDEEQEIYGQDKIDQFNMYISKTNEKLNNIKKSIASVKINIKKYSEKLKLFNNYKLKLLKNEK